MRALALMLVLCTPGVALAHHGGVTFGVQYGYAHWGFDEARLASQLKGQLPNPEGEAHSFVDNTHPGQALDLHLGFNVLGYGGVEADVMATGWNITTSDRGGGGFVGGVASFSPWNFFLSADRRWDAQVLAGYAYGLVGQHEAESGGVFNWGARGEFFLSKTVSVGAVVRFFHPNFHDFILDYDHRSDPGNTVDLPQGSGGLVWMVGAQLGIIVPVDGLQ